MGFKLGNVCRVCGKQLADARAKTCIKHIEHKPQSIETIKKRSEALKGHIVSSETREKIRQKHLGSKFSEEHKKKLAEAAKRTLNGFKKGHSIMLGRGKKMINYPEMERIRKSTEYKLWRKVNFERDNFTCQKYGTTGGRLVVHHINNFADFPELRLAIDNGITLSKKAHDQFHSIYGKRNNTKEQLEEFLKGRHYKN